MSLAQTEQINQSQLSSQRGEQIQSVWMAKKMDQQKAKEVDLLQNRILLLKKEEERTQKKIYDTQIKANTILTNKKRNEENNKKKQNNQKHDEQFLELMQKKSCGLRKAQKDEREAIRKALSDLKKEEAEEIKRVSQMNKRAIQESKLKQYEEKKHKHNYVQEVVNNSRKNIAGYWDERLRYFENQNENTKLDIQKSKSQKEQMLQRLEEEEMELIKRLQYSQDVHNQVCQKLDQVIQLNASEFEELHGPIIPTPAQKKKKTKNSQSLQFTNRYSYTNIPKKKQYKPIKKNKSQFQNSQPNQSNSNYNQENTQQMEQGYQQEQAQEEQQQAQDNQEQQQQEEQQQQQQQQEDTPEQQQEEQQQEQNDQGQNENNQEA